MTKRSESKNVVVTGGSSDSGRMIAVSFVQEAAGVAIDYSSNDDQAHKTEKRILSTCDIAGNDKEKALVVKADVS